MKNANLKMLLGAGMKKTDTKEADLWKTWNEKDLE